MDTKKQIIELINEKIFICESNIEYMRIAKMDDPDIFSDVEKQYNIYINLKGEIETMFKESESVVNLVD
jgi:hypothetical protein